MDGIQLNAPHFFSGPAVFSELEQFLRSRYSREARIFILTDDNTRQHCLPVLLQAIPQLETADVINIPPGEESKSIRTCEMIWTIMLRSAAKRNAVLINLGGGLVMDVGGLAAALYMRGIDCIQVPTSLLGMTDASVGGKTAVNFSGIKNPIGTFTQPIAIVTSAVFLKTLPDEELRSGYAEVLKHYLIADADAWNKAFPISWPPHADWDSLINTAIAIKRSICDADLYEKGPRKILNFGHTIGHALEALAFKTGKSLLHGEAIALGMMAATSLSQQYTGLPEVEATGILKKLKYLFGSLRIQFEPEEISAFMEMDKKSPDTQYKFVLLESIGKARMDESVTKEHALEAVQFVKSFLEE